MSLTRLVTVFCDVPECMNWVAHEPTAKLARAEARHYGWVHRKGQDICPQHDTAVAAAGPS